MVPCRFKILILRSTCSLLEVPLDYSNKSVGSVNLAIIKRPGDTDDAQEILVNPGGPGGSSVAMVIGDYEAIQEKIGTQYSLLELILEALGIVVHPATVSKTIPTLRVTLSLLKSSHRPISHLTTHCERTTRTCAAMVTGAQASMQ